MPRKTDIDWIAIKNEYINGNISYRALCEKYKIKLSTLRGRAKNEEWLKHRKEQQHKISTKVAQKTAEKIVNAEVDRLAKVYELSDKIAPMIDKAITQLETVILNGEIVDVGVVDTYKMRQIMQSLKDLKEIVKEDNSNDNDRLDKLLNQIEGNV